MPLLASELAQLVDDARTRLGGAAVQKVYVPRPGLCYLDLRVPGRTYTLCLSVEPEVARLSLVAERARGGEGGATGREATFQQLARRELVGRRLASVGLSSVESGPSACVRLAFEKAGSDASPRTLVAELLPHRGRLVLVASAAGAEVGAERILAATSANVEAARTARPGATYAAPESATLREGTSRLAPPLLEAAERLFGQQHGERESERLRREVAAPLKRRRAQLVRTLVKVEAEASRAPEAQAWKARGELLAPNVARLARGMRSIELTTFTADGEAQVTVPLDPALSPKAQVERCFRQYRRLLRGSEVARERLEKLRAELAGLESQLVRVETEPAPALAGALPRAPSRAVGPARAKPFREYRSAKGERILVGKHAKGNDELTFRVARPDDLWLHARGVGGAHVVVPLERGASAGQELLLDAAHLALFHSEAKGEPQGEVSYTPAKFVRRPKGGAPGQVFYTRERTFLVRLEPSRLERLLASASEVNVTQSADK